jgi:hypothetical protein
MNGKPLPDDLGVEHTKPVPPKGPPIHTTDDPVPPSPPTPTPPSGPGVGGG